MVKFQEKCKKMAYDNLQDIRRQEYVKDALEEKKFYKEMTKQEFAQKLLDKQEREKKVEIKKSLTDAWDGQVEYKRQKKMEMDKIKKQGSYSLMESERLHRTEEVEKKQKKQKLSTQDKTEQNMRDQKKTVDDNLEDILKKEAAYDSLLQKKLCNNMAKEEVAKMLREAHHQEMKTPKQKPLADELAARYQYKQKQKRETDRTERQGVLPGYRAEEIGARRQKKDPQQKLKTQNKTKKYMDNPDAMQWEMHHSVTEQGRDVQYESGFLDHESDCGIPDKDRSREIRKKIVYDQLSLIKKEEAKKRAFMEDKLLKEKRHRESAEQKREKLEKEKKAAAIKSLTNSWDSQIQRKRQEKKELCEIERKDMTSLIELERACGGANWKSINVPQNKQPADKHNDVKTSNISRPLLSRQKVTNTKPVKLPSLKSKYVHFSENCQENCKRVKFPLIYTPKLISGG
ncbi:calponin homology domain-containing protein DDB_G0272472-like isoform X2 [Poecilia latipinna]|uniref:calponin homology domain-containing protein DDB_G0272472-like isoform X1 n=1 Tax=Poecilia latipinna TaxID=48699 RepID=UPI00072ECCE6|nr:PREDICTED: calponin homology domain-containing protein DDB_G0272472-like isoform X1 [Poecilia latipinna]XP_014894071.1 PREDICTED: calponin homology domain-containing protein DDB_G0272472-like isoform X2 [Poecilia latipinna]